MKPSEEQEPRPGAWTRREFLTRPFAALGRTQPPQAICIPLSALRELPEAVLQRIVPILRRGWTAGVCPEGIAYRNDSGEDGIVPLGSDACAAAGMFDGVKSLEQVAAALDAESPMAPGQRAALVRETFLLLAEREVFHPNGPAGLLDRHSSMEDSHA
jgi:hypothetical protein